MDSFQLSALLMVASYIGVSFKAVSASGRFLLFVHDPKFLNIVWYSFAMDSEYLRYTLSLQVYLLILRQLQLQLILRRLHTISTIVSLDITTVTRLLLNFLRITT